MSVRRHGNRWFGSTAEFEMIGGEAIAFDASMAPNGSEPVVPELTAEGERDTDAPLPEDLLELMAEYGDAEPEGGSETPL